MVVIVSYEIIDHLHLVEEVINQSPEQERRRGTNKVVLTRVEPVTKRRVNGQDDGVVVELFWSMFRCFNECKIIWNLYHFCWIFKDVFTNFCRNLHFISYIVYFVNIYKNYMIEYTD